MRNKILIFVTFVFVSLGAFATTNTLKHNLYNNSYGDSFTFVERGVTFSVFQNGEFDFYINPRNDFQIGYRNRNVNISFNSGYNYDAYVQYDAYGAIIQVEDIPIYYDYYGRVRRIGNINLSYQYGRLARLGGMFVHYDNYGYYSYYTGYINNYNRTYSYHPYHNYFSRPLFEFRVVSYKPYRSHYNPNRYRYYRDHSRNTYSRKNYKRNGYNTRKRVATNRIPKRKNDSYNNTRRNNTRSYTSSNRTIRNTRNSNFNSGIKRNTAVTKTTRNTRAITNRTENIKRSTRNSERVVQQNRKPVRVQEIKSAVTKNKRAVISQNKYRKNSVKSKPIRTVERTKTITNKSRNPMRKERSNRVENTRKRRS